jgi:hypothetical protein
MIPAFSLMLVNFFEMLTERADSHVRVQVGAVIVVFV